MAAWRVVPLAALLLAASWSALAQGSVEVQLAGLDVAYGPESWKDEPALGALLPPVPGGLPAGAPPVLGVYENPYLNPAQPHQGASTWLGARATATLALRDAGGQAVADPTLYVTARLVHAQGEVLAKLTRLGQGRFTADFDLDGEDGANLTAVPLGSASLVVEAMRPAAAPGATPARVAGAAFPLQFGSAQFDRAGFALPDASLPGYADTGPGNATLVQDTYLEARPGRPAQLRAMPAAPAASLAYVADLGVAGASVRIVAWHRDARTLDRNGTTDAAGRFAFNVTAGALTGNASGLAVLAAHLDGSQGRVATAVLAVPVSSHALRVARFDFRPGGAADQPLAELDMLDVTVADPAAGDGRPLLQGNVSAIDLSNQVLASAPFQPGQDRSTLVASLPALALRRDGLAGYRVVATLQEPDGTLYGLAQAMRGFSLSGGDGAGVAFVRGTLPVVVRNFNNNLDDQRDPGLALPVRVRVAGLPGEQFHVVQVTVDESQELTLAVPFAGDAGDYPLDIEAVSGELQATLAGRVRVAPADHGLLGLPAPDALPVLGALALAAFAAQRRTRA